MVSVLVVDDDSQVRWTLRQFLEYEGHDVVEAENGEVASNIYLESRPQVAIVDIVMPVKEGIETIMHLRQFDHTLRIVAISGAATMDAANYLEWAKALGADVVLRKPFSRQQLMEAITPGHQA